MFYGEIWLIITISLFLPLIWSTERTNANSADPDQMLLNATFDQGIHCLHKININF